MTQIDDTLPRYAPGIALDKVYGGSVAVMYQRGDGGYVKLSDVCARSATPSGLIDDLDEDAPNWYLNAATVDFMEGIGATEDHEAIKAALLAGGFTECVATRIMQLIVGVAP